MGMKTNDTQNIVASQSLEQCSAFCKLF